MSWAILFIFAGWDECSAFAAEFNLRNQGAYGLCAMVPMNPPPEPLPPVTSLRPRARND